MSQKVELVFTAQEAAAVAGIMKIIQQMGKIDTAYQDTGRKGKTAVEQLAKGWSSVGVDAGKAIMTIAGVASATQAAYGLTRLLTAEWQNVVNLQKESRDIKLDAGRGIAQLYGSVPSGANISAQELEDMVRKARTWFSTKERASVIADATSAGGDPSKYKESVAKGVMALELHDDLTADEVGALATGVVRLDESSRLPEVTREQYARQVEKDTQGRVPAAAIMNQSTPRPGEATSAMIRQMAAQAPLEQGQYADAYRNMVNGIIQLQQLGFTLEEAGAMVVGTSNAAGDSTLRRTQSGLVGMGVQLKKHAIKNPELGAKDAGELWRLLSEGQGEDLNKTRQELLGLFLESTPETGKLPPGVLEKLRKGKGLDEIDMSYHGEIRTLLPIISLLQPRGSADESDPGTGLYKYLMAKKEIPSRELALYTFRKNQAELATTETGKIRTRAREAAIAKTGGLYAQDADMADPSQTLWDMSLATSRFGTGYFKANVNALDYRLRASGKPDVEQLEVYRDIVSKIATDYAAQHAAPLPEAAPGQTAGMVRTRKPLPRTPLDQRTGEDYVQAAGITNPDVVRYFAETITPLLKSINDDIRAQRAAAENTAANTGETARELGDQRRERPVPSKATPNAPRPDQRVP